METTATLPTQLQMSMVVMLAKNEKVELTSVLYRTWRRLRKTILDTWQLELPRTMDYDRARPGATALHVALERLLRQESNKTLGKHGITVLLDMSTFYDTIDLTKLQQVAQSLNYPALALEFCHAGLHWTKGCHSRRGTQSLVPRHQRHGSRMSPSTLACQSIPATHSQPIPSQAPWDG